MPSSSPTLIKPIINVLINLAPKTVLDIGVGFGRVGFLAREFLEVWEDGRADYPKEKSDWNATVDGIEVFEGYIGRLQKEIYDTIYIGDAREILPTLGEYDLIVMSEVIEHMPKEDGVKIIERCKAGQAKTLLITTPAEFKKQKVKFGNEAETHLSLWQQNDFKDLGCVFGQTIPHERKKKDGGIVKTSNHVVAFRS